MQGERRKADRRNENQENEKESRIYKKINKSTKAQRDNNKEKKQ